MKRSYYIVGVCFDRLSLPGEEPELIELDADELLPVGAPENLFDRGSVRRELPLSSVFGCRDGSDDLEVLLGRVRACDEVVLIDDYPLTEGSVMREFVRRRALQVYALIKQRAPSVKVRLGAVRAERGAAYGRVA